jgi:hypothetical protein
MYMENMETWIRGNSTTTTTPATAGTERKAASDIASSPGPNGGESDPEKLAWESLGFTKPANGLVSKRQARDMVRARIMADMPAMLDAQISQAKGLKYMVARDESGKFRRIGPEELAAGAVGVEVWEKDPSTAAFTDLMNRAIDKPKEQEQELIIHNSEELLARLDSWKVANRQAQPELPTPQDVVEGLVEAPPQP